MLRPYITTDQISNPPQITGTLFAHRRGEQHWPPRLHARPHERLANRHERRQAAGVVGDPRALEPGPAPRDRHIELGTEDGVQMGR